MTEKTWNEIDELAQEMFRMSKRGHLGWNKISPNARKRWRVNAKRKVQEMV